MTAGSTGMDSAWAMCWRRAVDDVESSGVKRNFEQRDARGSIILFWWVVGGVSEGLRVRKTLPGDIVTNEAETGDAGVGFHDPTESTLCVLGH